MLVACLSRGRLGFYTWEVHVEFVEYKVTEEQVIFGIFLFIHITPPIRSYLLLFY